MGQQWVWGQGEARPCQPCHQVLTSMKCFKLTCECMLSHFSCVRLFATPWTIALHGNPLSMGFSRQELEWVAISFSRGSSRPRD